MRYKALLCQVHTNTKIDLVLNQQIKRVIKSWLNSDVKTSRIKVEGACDEAAILLKSERVYDLKQYKTNTSSVNSIYHIYVNCRKPPYQIALDHLNWLYIQEFGFGETKKI